MIPHAYSDQLPSTSSGCPSRPMTPISLTTSHNMKRDAASPFRPELTKLRNPGYFQDWMSDTRFNYDSSPARSIAPSVMSHLTNQSHLSNSSISNWSGMTVITQAMSTLTINTKIDYMTTGGYPQMAQMPRPSGNGMENFDPNTTQRMTAALDNFINPQMQSFLHWPENQQLGLIQYIYEWMTHAEACFRHFKSAMSVEEIGEKLVVQRSLRLLLDNIISVLRSGPQGLQLKVSYGLLKVFYSSAKILPFVDRYIDEKASLSKSNNPITDIVNFVRPDYPFHSKAIDALIVLLSKISTATGKRRIQSEYNHRLAAAYENSILKRLLHVVYSDTLDFDTKKKALTLIWMLIRSYPKARHDFIKKMGEPMNLIRSGFLNETMDEACLFYTISIIMAVIQKWKCADLVPALTEQYSLVQQLTLLISHASPRIQTGAMKCMCAVSDVASLRLGNPQFVAQISQTIPQVAKLFGGSDLKLSEYGVKYLRNLMSDCTMHKRVMVECQGAASVARLLCTCNFIFYEKGNIQELVTEGVNCLKLLLTPSQPEFQGPNENAIIEEGATQVATTQEIAHFLLLFVSNVKNGRLDGLRLMYSLCQPERLHKFVDYFKVVEDEKGNRLLVTLLNFIFTPEYSNWANLSEMEKRKVTGICGRALRLLTLLIHKEKPFGEFFADAVVSEIREKNCPNLLFLLSFSVENPVLECLDQLTSRPSGVELLKIWMSQHNNRGAALLQSLQPSSDRQRLIVDNLMRRAMS